MPARLRSLSEANISTISRQQLLSNFIPPDYCDSVWQKCVRRTCDNPAFARFKGCRIFFNGKDFKSYTSSTTYAGLNAKWSQLWSFSTDEAYLDDDEWWLDPGRQYSPQDKSLQGDVTHAAHHEAEIYLPKTCCIRGMHQKRTASCPKSHLRMDTYYHATLRDTCSATFTPHVNSKEFRLGRVYSQVYAKSKVNFTTSTVETLAEPAMETLALDPDYVKSVQHVGGGVSVSLPTQKRVYIRSKNHAHQSLLNATRLPFGVRYEERLRASLWKAVLTRLVSLEHVQAQGPESNTARDTAEEDAGERPYYIVPSETFFGFIRGQINKFCLGFEYTLWKCNSKYTKWEQTQAAIVFLRAVRHSFGTSAIQQESLLWKDRWSRQRKYQPRRGRRRDEDESLRGLSSHHEGLAMSVTVQRCGIGWFAPKFDWATWELKAEHAAKTLLENPGILAHYQRRRGAIEDVKDIYMRLHQVERWVSRYQDSSEMLRRIVDYLSGLCLQQFRADVYKHLARDGVLQDSAVERATAGHLPLCYQALQGALTDGEPWLVTGNKADIRDPVSLVEYLFDWQPFDIVRGSNSKTKERLHWEALPYRSLFHKSYLFLTDHFGGPAARTWRDDFRRAMLVLNTVLPYPDYNTFFSRTKARAGRGADVTRKTRRCWMAVWVQPQPDAIQIERRDTGQGILIEHITSCLAPSATFMVGGTLPDNSNLDMTLPPSLYYDLHRDVWQSDDCMDRLYRTLQRQ